MAADLAIVALPAGRCEGNCIAALGRKGNSVGRGVQFGLRRNGAR